MRPQAEALAARIANKWNVPATDNENYAMVADSVGKWLSEQGGADTLVVICHGIRPHPVIFTSYETIKT